MFDISLSEDYFVDMDGTSEGTQPKYQKDGWWYKKNSMGNEAAAETLASVVLSCSSLQPQEYVPYEYGHVNKAPACRSRDFLKPGENLITLYRFHEQVAGQKINEITARLGSPKERAEYTLDFFREYAKADLAGYFARIFTIDLITLNDDRHFNNLAIIRNSEGSYRPAPIFDNGKSLFIGNYSIKESLPFEENRRRLSSRPFSGSPETQYRMFGPGFTVDFEAAERKLQELDPEIKETDEYKTLLQNFAYTKERHPELISPEGSIRNNETAVSGN